MIGLFLLLIATGIDAGLGVIPMLAVLLQLAGRSAARTRSDRWSAKKE
jgi:hypothetical protein